MVSYQAVKKSTEYIYLILLLNKINESIEKLKKLVIIFLLLTAALFEQKNTMGKLWFLFLCTYQNKNHSLPMVSKVSSLAGSIPFAFVAKHSRSLHKATTPFSSQIGTGSSQNCLLMSSTAWRYLRKNTSICNKRG